MQKTSCAGAARVTMGLGNKLFDFDLKEFRHFTDTLSQFCQFSSCPSQVNKCLSQSRRNPKKLGGSATSASTGGKERQERDTGLISSYVVYAVKKCDVY